MWRVTHQCFIGNGGEFNLTMIILWVVVFFCVFLCVFLNSGNRIFSTPTFNLLVTVSENLNMLRREHMRKDEINDQRGGSLDLEMADGCTEYHGQRNKKTYSGLVHRLT